MIAILSTTHGAGHGAEVVLVELLRAWQAGGTLPLTVVAPSGSAVAEAAGAAGHALVRLGTSRDAIAVNLTAGHAAVRAIRDCRLVHAWTARGLEVAWWMAHRLRTSSTATIHDHPDSSAQSAFRRRLWRRAANLPAAIAFPSSALQEAWRTSGLRRPSRVIRNGSSPLALQRRDRADGTLVIGFLGMYAPWKGFALAREWARAGWPPNVRWMFYGDVHHALADGASSLLHEPGYHVDFPGAQPRERIFGEVDLLVHCSTGFDPFPTVLLEAARAGVPVVASTLGGAGEIVVHGETGFLFDPLAPDVGLAHLRRLVDDAALRTRLAAAARGRFDRHFRVERMAAGYAAFWQAALEGAFSG